MEEISAIVNKDGSITIETTGFKGSGCINLLDSITKDLEAMGIKTSIKDQKKKPEYYAAGTTATIKTGGKQ
jgi:Protein of unknown function (DUF2997)